MLNSNQAKGALVILCLDGLNFKRVLYSEQEPI